MNKLVSVIVPVYNVSVYLDECIASLVNQSYGNLEILLIDDGSKDQSGEICDRWAEKDSRIMVIHKKNGGAASARNAGIDAATGDYICFVDGDDAASPEYINTLRKALEGTNSDAAVCGFFLWGRSKQEACCSDTAPGVYGCGDYMLRFLRDWSCSLLWNKLFKREAIGDIRMEEGHRVDDEFFTYQVCMNCKKVAVIDSRLYHYRMRASSAMQDAAAIQEKTMLDRIGYNVARYHNVSVRMPQLEEPYFVSTLDSLARYWHHSRNMPMAQQQIRAWVKAHTVRILKLSISLRQKFGYLRRLYLKKPAVMAEPNPIQMDPQEYFD